MEHFVGKQWCERISENVLHTWSQSKVPQEDQILRFSSYFGWSKLIHFRLVCGSPSVRIRQRATRHWFAFQIASSTVSNWSWRLSNLQKAVPLTQIVIRRNSWNQQVDTCSGTQRHWDRWFYSGNCQGPRILGASVPMKMWRCQTTNWNALEWIRIGKHTTKAHLLADIVIHQQVQCGFDIHSSGFT